MLARSPLNWLPVEIVPCAYWGNASLTDVRAVLSSVRAGALTELPLDATRIPSRITVIVSETEPVPMTYAYDSADGAATIRVNAPNRLWAKLSYNFDHELGDVLAGSWRADATSAGPTHWLEEVVVDAFAIFTLKQMGERWSIALSYPDPSWSSYASELHKYANVRMAELRSHQNYAAFVVDGAAWFRTGHNEIIASLPVTAAIWPVIPWLVDQYVSDKALVADLAGMNPWPERSRIPLTDYLDRWECSAGALHLPARLPALLHRQLL